MSTEPKRPICGNCPDCLDKTRAYLAAVRSGKYRPKPRAHVKSK